MRQQGSLPPKEVFQVSSLADSGTSTPAPLAYLNMANLTKANALRLKVRIDNASCTADIHDATINGTPSGICGFLHYANRAQNVKLEFEASHPRDFATFGWSVVKGNGMESPGINASGYVISSVGGYSLVGDDYERLVSVDNLLGSCNQASFAEHLRVYSIATNGTRRLHEYDASDLESFALTQ